MNTLVETIQKIGIFLIAAQAIMHFAPGTAYTKYIKLIVSIMILAMFLSPIYQLITGEIIISSLDAGCYGITKERTKTPGFSMRWEEMEAYIENQTWKQETVLEQMEDEIKSRLNQEIQKMYLQNNSNTSGRTLKYEISNVIIKDTEPIYLRIVVYRTTSFVNTDGEDYQDQENISGDDAVNIDIIQISEIIIGENSRNEERGQQEVNENNLAEWFADILELESDQLEVIVYESNQ